MIDKRTLRSVLTVAILLTSSLPVISYAGQFLGIPLPSIDIVHPVFAVATPIFVDCDTNTGGPTGGPVSSCAWVPPSPGPPPGPALFGQSGGGVLDINAGDTLNPPPAINGFDISFTFDPTVINIVGVDQSGTGWTGALILAKTIDNAGGNFRLAEVLLGGSVSSSGALFRIDFDVVGVGVSPIAFVSAALTNPAPVATLTTDGAFDDTGAYSTWPLGSTLSFTFTPAKPTPSSSITFTATAVCASCAALSFTWDFDSDGVAGTPDASTNPATISPPYPSAVNVVTLTATDGTNTASITREIPLSAMINGPTTVAVGSALTLTGSWIGGIPPYTQSGSIGWRFCPGSATITTVCTRPSATIPSSPFQTSSPGSVTYNFGGIYNDTLSLTDSGVGLAKSTVFVFEPVTVTGTPSAFSTLVTSSASSVTVGGAISFTATVSYPGDPAVVYDTNANGVYDPSVLRSDAAPAVGTTLKTDSKILFLDANSNAKWDAVEAVVYDTDGSGSFTTGDIVITGNAPALAATLSLDPLIKFVDSNNNNVWNSGEPIVYDSGAGTPVVGANNNLYDAGEPVVSIVSIKFVDTNNNGSLDSSEVVVYDANGNGQYDTGEPVIFGVAPGAGTALKTDVKIKFIDANNNNVWDSSPSPGETVAYDTNNNGIYETGERVILAGTTVANAEPVIGGAAPALGTALVFDPKLDLIGVAPWTATKPVVYDTDASLKYDTGEPVISGNPTAFGVTLVSDPKIKFVDADANGVFTLPFYPYLFRSAGFKYTFDFGDGGTPTVVTGALTATASHTFNLIGSFTVTVTAQETAATSAVSRIQESGTIPVMVNPAGTALCSSGCDFTFAPTSPTVGQSVSFSATATGGTAPYTFAWTFGDGTSGTGQTPSHTYSAKGPFTATLTITDSATPTHATSIVTHTITVMPQTLAVTISCGTATAGKPVTCMATPTGGTSPYSFTWSVDGVVQSGATTATFTTTIAIKGSHSIVAAVKDANTVSATSNTVSLTVAGQPLTTDFTFAPTNPLAGQSVTFTASGSGGTGPYTFTWTFGDTSTGTGSPASHSYAAKGMFTVTLTTKDANTVTAIASHTVAVSGSPLVPSFTFSPSSPTAGKPVSFSASATGGTSPYTFTWTFGDTGTGTGATIDHTYAAKGSFSVVLTVKDANTATQTLTKTVVVVGQPVLVSIACGSATAGKPVTCTATPSGGTSPYSFTWSVDGVVQTGATTSTFTTTFATKATHSIVATAKDANAVSATSNTVSLTVAAQPLAVTISCGTATAGKPVNCTATPAGGTSPYSFTWSVDGVVQTGATTSTFTTTFATKGTHSILATVNDANLVSATSNTLSLTVAGQPLSVSISCGTATAGKPVTCTATPTGGTSPYSFTWSVDGVVQTGATTSSFTTTFATKGTHSIVATVKDANTVSATSNTLTVTVSGQPLAVSFNFSPTSPTTADIVTFTATPSGGTSPYSFSWNFGDNSPVATGNPVTHTFAAGTFTVLVTLTDSNSATTMATQTVMVTQAISALTVDFSINPAAPQVGGTVTFTPTVTGGTTPYGLTWNFGDGSPTVTETTLVAVTHVYNSKSSAAGFTISLAVTDSTMPPNLGSKSHTLVVSPLPLAADFTFTPASPVAGGTVSFSATASGGTSPYAFSWTFGDGSTGTGGSPTHSYAIQGSYIVVVTATDANMQTTTATHTVAVSPQPLAADFSSSAPAPVGSTVTFTATVSGGTMPYSYAWDFGDSSTGSGNPASHTYSTAGLFTVTLTVTDTNQQTTTASHTVAITAIGLTVDFTFSPTSPGVGDVVTFTASVSGGTMPYSFSWTLGDGSTGTGATLTHSYSAKGSHTVNLSVSDSSVPALSGTATHTVAVSPLPLAASFTVSPSPTVGSPVTFTASVTGGTSPYSYAWNFGDSLTGSANPATHTYSAKGSYTVTLAVTDANTQTTISTQVVIVAPLALSTSFTVSPSPTVGTPVTFTASATGGTAPYSFAWNFGDSSTGSGSPASHSYSSAGSFTVTLTTTDGNSVVTTSSQTIVVASLPLSADFTFAPSSPTIGQTISFTSSVTGGTMPYSYGWDFGDGTSSTSASPGHVYSTSGTFTVILTVTDANNVVATASHMVTVSPVTSVGDFSVAVNPAHLSLVAGTARNVTVVVHSINFAGTVTLTVTITPAVANGPSGTFSKTILTLTINSTANSKLRLATLASTSAGSYNVNVTATSGGRSHSAVATLTVTGFKLTADPSSLTVQAGSSGMFTLTLESQGFSGSVRLKADISPAAEESPVLALSGSTVIITSDETAFAVLQVFSDEHTALGTYTIVISATGHGLTHSANVHFTVTDLTALHRHNHQIDRDDD